MNKPLFDGKIQHADIFRLLYLASYMGYDSNKLAYRNGRSICKSNLNNILNLSEKQYYELMKKCIENNLIFFHDDNSISLTDKYFSKGRLGKKDWKRKGSIIRVYCKTIQHLYMNHTPIHHKNVSYLFMLIPHVNQQYNIVCSNPPETTLNNIIPLNLKELCKAIKFSTNNAKCIKAHLNNIRINNRPVVSFMESYNGINTLINPAVYYAGNIHDEVSVIVGFNKENNPQIKEETL